MPVLFQKYGAQTSFPTMSWEYYHRKLESITFVSGGGVTVIDAGHWSEVLPGPGPGRDVENLYLSRTDLLPIEVYTGFRNKVSTSLHFSQKRMTCSVDYYPEVTSSKRPAEPRKPSYRLPARRVLKRPTFNGRLYELGDIPGLTLGLTRIPRVNFDLGVSRNTKSSLLASLVAQKLRSQLEWWFDVDSRRKEFKANYDQRFQQRMLKYQTLLQAYKVKLRKWERKEPPHKYSKRVKKVLPRFTTENPFEDTQVSVPSVGDGGIVSVISRFGGYAAVRQTSVPLGGGFYRNLLVYSNAITTRTMQADDDALQDFQLQLYASLSEHLGALDKKCALKNASKLANQKVHVGTLTAERAQTLSMLQSLIKRLADVVSLKKNLFKSAVGYLSHPKLIADDYLAFQFGIKPLVNDIFSAVQLLAESADPENVSTIVTRSNSHAELKTLCLVGDFTYEFTGTINVSLVEKYIVNNDLARSLQTLGLVNPAEIAWEMLPWSFVIDWFVPVGAYIRSLTGDTGVTFVVGTRTVTTVGSFRRVTTPSLQIGSVRMFPADPAEFAFVPAFSTQYEQKTGVSTADTLYVNLKQRTVLDVPALNREQVVIKSPFSWTHNLEATALLVQRFLSPRSRRSNS